MTRNFITFTQNFNLSDGTSATLPNSFINMRREVINLCKTAVENSGLGFTLLQEDTPTAAATAQTQFITYDTNMVCNETGNWLFRIAIVWQAMNSANNNCTIRAELVRAHNASGAMPIMSNVAASWTTASPVQLTVDIESFLAQTSQSISVGVTRANAVTVLPADMFSQHTLFRYMLTASGETRWGGVINSVANQPLRNIPTTTAALTSVGFSAQTQGGHIESPDANINALEMPVIFWNATNSVSAPLVCSFDKESDPDLIFVTASLPEITPGKILNPLETQNDFYVVSVFLGKAALVKITP